MFNNFEKRIPMSGKGELQQISCPLCGTHYDSNNAKIIFEKEDAFLLYTDCHTCGSSVIAALITNQLGMSSIGLITDLTFGDAVKFKESEVISPDEVLDIYTVFERKSESLPSLLS